MNELDTTRRTTGGTPEITHELLEFHIRRGRQLRAQAMQQGLRCVWRWLTHDVWAGRQRGRRTARHAH